MSGYLAFDRDALSWLQIKLIYALNEIGSAVTRDPAAASAHRNVRLAVDALRGWDTRIGGITGCIALEDYRPVGGLSDAEFLIWKQLAGGRSIVTDPFAGPDGVDETTRAIALAKAIASGDVDDFTSADGKAALRGELGIIAGSPMASAAFVRTLGERKFIELMNTITAPIPRYPNSMHEPDELDSTDVPAELATIDSLGRVFGRFRATASDEERERWDEALLADADPLPLARLVRAGVENGDVWSYGASSFGGQDAWSDNDIERYATAVLEQLDLNGCRLADEWAGAEALWLLAKRPAVARSFLEEADSHLLEQALLALDDPIARMALLSSSTNFGTAEPDLVRESMQRVIDTLYVNADMITLYDQHISGFSTLPPGVGAYFLPYLPEILSLHSLRSGPRWEWTDGVGGGNQRGQFLDLLFRDDATRELYQQWAWQQFDTAISSPTPDHDAGDLKEFNGPLYESALAIQMFARTITNGEIQELESTRSGVELGLTLLGYVPGVGTGVSIANDAIGGAVLDALGLSTQDLVTNHAKRREATIMIMIATGLDRWLSQNPSVHAVVPPVIDLGEVEKGDDATIAQDKMTDAIRDWDLTEAQRDEVNMIIKEAAAGARAGDDHVVD